MTSDLIEQRRRRPSGHDGIRHCVGVTLVDVARLIDAALALHAAALLNHMRGLVRRRVQAACCSHLNPMLLRTPGKPVSP
jgi:hypothetical protein